MPTTSFIRRVFDDCTRLVLGETQRPDGSWESIDIVSAHCRNPDCPCRSVRLEAQRVERSPDGEVLRRGAAVEARLDLDSKEITIATESAPPTESSLELLESVRRLVDEDVFRLLEERERRVKGQRDDEWKDVDWDSIGIDTMVPFCEAFPSTWDLSLSLGPHLYWLIDAWCLQPGCDCACDAVAIEIVDASGPRIGMVRLDVRRWRVEDVSGSDEQQLRLVAREMLADGLLQQKLRLRRKVMQGVARELPHHLDLVPRPIQSAPKPGRNEPCPCGSGKKYKRCCGR